VRAIALTVVSSFIVACSGSDGVAITSPPASLGDGGADAAVEAGHTPTKECTEGQTRCSDNAVQTCNALGAWAAVQSCTSSACVDGVCKGSCAPGEKQCSDDGLQTCTANGAWGAAVACSNQTCVGAYPAAACQGVCAPGQKLCTGTSAQTCDAAGAWGTLVTAPPSCTSIAGSEGRCVSAPLIDSIARLAPVLPRSTCGVGVVCAPCFDPTAADPTLATGVCKTACDAPTAAPTVLACPWSGPSVFEPAALPSCSPACGGAHCVPGALVPPGQIFATCTGGYCVPDSTIRTNGNEVPTKCAPFAGVTDTTKGRCLSTCLPAIASQADLETSTCGTGKKCVPCSDPFSGASTGACTTSSCDADPVTPYTYPTCCMYNGAPQGRCVPKSQIPDARESDFSARECAGIDADYLCVTNEQLAPPNGAGGKACTATSIGNPLGYTGTCLSKCMNLGDFAEQLYAQGNCSANQLCVPCANAPPGSAGCP
jgi:hypothetical protein